MVKKFLKRFHHLKTSFWDSSFQCSDYVIIIRERITFLMKEFITSNSHEYFLRVKRNFTWDFTSRLVEDCSHWILQASLVLCCKYFINSVKINVFELRSSYVNIFRYSEGMHFNYFIWNNLANHSGWEINYSTQGNEHKMFWWNVRVWILNHVLKL